MPRKGKRMTWHGLTLGPRRSSWAQTDAPIQVREASLKMDNFMVLNVRWLFDDQLVSDEWSFVLCVNSEIMTKTVR